MTLGAKHNQFSQSKLFDVLRGGSASGVEWLDKVPIVDYGPASRVFSVTVRDGDNTSKWIAAPFFHNRRGIE